MHRDLQATDVLEECKKESVTQVLPLFCDVLGVIKAHQIPAARMAEAFKRGVVIDGSSIEGYARINESDYRAVPDPRTFRVLPWEVGGQKTAVILCDVVEPSGKPFAGDPRYILRRVLESPALKESTVNVGPEAEFFYFKTPERPEILDRGGYYSLDMDSIGFDLRTKTMSNLTSLGIEVEAGHHEVAPSQHEIDLRYKPALVMADQLLVYRWVVKRVAQMNGCYATFMPKPLAGVNGSGMHVHLSVFHGGKNLFFDEKDGKSFHLSEMGLHFLAGILHHAPAITPLTNPRINSYKRLVPGYEAPVYLCWGSANRSALVRKPNYEPGHEEATRIEARFPDPSCNPYLAFAALIAAGMDGVGEGMEAPEPVEVDVYHLSPEERADRKIASLPGSLGEALRLFEQSKLTESVLGPHAFQSIRANITKQLDAWRLAVTDWELNEYLPVL